MCFCVSLPEMSSEFSHNCNIILRTKWFLSSLGWDRMGKNLFSGHLNPLNSGNNSVTLFLLLLLRFPGSWKGWLTVLPVRKNAAADAINQLLFIYKPKTNTVQLVCLKAGKTQVIYIDRKVFTNTLYHLFFCEIIEVNFFRSDFRWRLEFWFLFPGGRSFLSMMWVFSWRKLRINCKVIRNC